MKRDLHAIPNIDDLLQRLHNKAIFTAIDLSHGYWSVPMHPDSTKYTGIVTSDGRIYTAKRMMEGFANAPGHYQSEMRKLFADLPYVNVYIDDIIIASASVDEHRTHLRTVFERLDNARLTISLHKCQFGYDKLRYLGYLISSDGVKMDPQKQEIFKNLASPTNVKDVRRVLGITGFYRKFIPTYAQDTISLTNLLKGGGQKFYWSPECERDFRKLINKLSQTLTLYTADPEKRFYVFGDASDEALGVALMQKVDGQFVPIEFASRKFSESELHYTTTEKELIAIVYATAKWRHWLHLNNFTVLTDHKALTYFMNLKQLTGRLARWFLRLMEFPITIEYLPGEKNVVADFLSRMRFDESRLHIDDTVIELDVKRIEERITHSAVETDDQGRPLNYEDIIRYAHDFGHYGKTITMKRIQTICNWDSIEEDVTKVLEKCHQCHIGNIRHTGYKLPLKLQDIGNLENMEEIYIDFHDALPDNCSDFTTVLRIVDSNSRFM
eukprot:Nk52_evm28s2426 gene=Nk52_evmTU28s2426